MPAFCCRALQSSASMPMNAASLSPVSDFAENPTSLCSSENADSTAAFGPANFKSSVYTASSTWSRTYRLVSPMSRIQRHDFEMRIFRSHIPKSNPALWRPYKVLFRGTTGFVICCHAAGMTRFGRLTHTGSPPSGALGYACTISASFVTPSLYAAACAWQSRIEVIPTGTMWCSTSTQRCPWASRTSWPPTTIRALIRRLDSSNSAFFCPSTKRMRACFAFGSAWMTADHSRTSPREIAPMSRRPWNSSWTAFSIAGEVLASQENSSMTRKTNPSACAMAEASFSISSFFRSISKRISSTRSNIGSGCALGGRDTRAFAERKVGGEEKSGSFERRFFEDDAFVVRPAKSNGGPGSTGAGT